MNIYKLILLLILFISFAFQQKNAFDSFRRRSLNKELFENINQTYVFEAIFGALFFALMITLLILI